MRFLRRALESSVEQADDGKSIVMKGPLSEIYTQALNKVYAKNNDEDQVGDSANFAQANDELVSSGQQLESFKDEHYIPKKKKKLDLKNIKKGSFHEWLGKKPSEEITDKDIEKGLKDKDPHVKKMALFAKNAKKWHKKKVAKESFTGYALESFSDNLVSKYAAESQQMDVAIMDKMAEAVNGKNTASPTDNFTTVYGVSKNDLDEQDAVDVVSELAATPEGGEFVLITDFCAPGTNGTIGGGEERSEIIGQSLECLVECHGGKVFHSLNDYIASRR